MADDITALRVQAAAQQASKPAKPQAASTAEWAFGDILSGLIQLGRTEETVKIHKEVVRAVDLEHAREAVAECGVERYVERERPGTVDAESADITNKDMASGATQQAEVSRKVETTGKEVADTRAANAAVKEEVTTDQVKLSLNAEEIKVSSAEGGAEETWVSEGVKKAEKVTYEAPEKIVLPADARAAAPEAASSGMQSETGMESRTGGREAVVERMDAPASKETAAGAFEKLVSKTVQKASSQEAMIERITEFAKNSGAKAAGHIRMTLHPKSLGSMQMDITVKDGTMTVACRVEDPLARGIILGGMDDLRAALAEQGITLSEFNVSTNGEESGAGRDFGDALSAVGSADAENGAGGREELALSATPAVLLDLTA